MATRKPLGSVVMRVVGTLDSDAAYECLSVSGLGLGAVRMVEYDLRSFWVKSGYCGRPEHLRDWGKYSQSQFITGQFSNEP